MKSLTAAITPVSNNISGMLDKGSRSLQPLSISDFKHFGANMKPQSYTSCPWLTPMHMVMSLPKIWLCNSINSAKF